VSRLYSVRTFSAHHLENLDLVAELGKNFVIIMKVGKIYRNTIPNYGG